MGKTPKSDEKVQGIVLKTLFYVTCVIKLPRRWWNPNQNTCSLCAVQWERQLWIKQNWYVFSKTSRRSSLS